MSSSFSASSRLRLARCATLLVLCACQGPVPAPSGAPPPMRRPLGPVPGAHASLVATPNPLEGDTVATARGQKLFTSFNCAGCHGDHGGGGMGPSLRDEDWIYGSTGAAIYSSIADGRAHGMPAWGTKLPESQIWELVAYIRSLRTDAEPMKADQSIPPPPAG